VRTFERASARKKVLYDLVAIVSICSRHVIFYQILHQVILHDLQREYSVHPARDDLPDPFFVDGRNR